MSVQDWAGLILTTLSIVALVAGGIRWLTKHYFDEIRAEFKPNGGSSLKDQVNRLEKKTSELNERINEADTMRREMNSKLDKMYMILLDHVAKNNKE
jgi:hypothetical protein